MAHAYSVSDYPGIDYSSGRDNRDPDTGFHYGVIHSSAEGLSIDMVMDTFEPDYGDPLCPVCGGEVTSWEDFDFDGYIGGDQHFDIYRYSACDYVCDNCHLIIGSDHVYSDEPSAYLLDRHGYLASFQSDSDIVIVKSPFYTYAQYCSPCVPGAGNLHCPCFTQIDDGSSPTGYRIEGNGPRTYCFGHEWFDGDRAPYPVFLVADADKEVFTPIVEIQ